MRRVTRSENNTRFASFRVACFECHAFIHLSFLEACNILPDIMHVCRGVVSSLSILMRYEAFDRRQWAFKWCAKAATARYASLSADASYLL